ncbi:HDOD domain-containing protein [Massilia sp. Dwa41.01b]|uniref:HDOD domain-containing protein n=1 Tax=Massilia sp. Dwa41.01b TaxID=2709302 RepID=UPI002803E91C|nr:HDOD domain-containing protein [Massilia sp. Dwa41.01b]
MAEASPPVPDEGTTRRVRAALMQKVTGEAEMFALGSAVARVIELASSDEPGPHDLAYYVLSDVALTQRILRLSNTVQYRTVSGTTVTTVSRAIALLGFDNVKTTALAMLLVDTLDNGQHAGSVRVELEAALCASLVGREMARLSCYQGAEEAAIGALFKNLGALLVASHEHARYREIGQLVATGKHTPSQASQLILGCSYDTLAAAVLGEWKIPDVIVRAQATLPSGTLKVAASRAEWMRQVASFSIEVARLLGRPPAGVAPSATPEARALLARYGAAFELDQAGLERIFDNVAAGMQALMESMNLRPLPPPAAEEGTGLPDVLLLAALGGGDEDGVHPSGKPKNARELLLAGVQDVTQLRAGGRARVNEVIPGGARDAVPGAWLSLRHRLPERCAPGPVPRPRLVWCRAGAPAGRLCLPRRDAVRARPVPAGDGERRRPHDCRRRHPEDPRVVTRLAPQPAAGREEFHRVAADRRPGAAGLFLCRPRPARARRRAAG